MLVHVSIDPTKNILLCSTQLVGIGELVELYQSAEGTPMQLTGKVMRKVADPNQFEVCSAYESQEFVGKRYEVSENCIFRVLMKKLGGTRRRKFCDMEKKIVNVEQPEGYQERKVVKAKTGSVRKKSAKKKSRSKRRVKVDAKRRKAKR